MGVSAVRKAAGHRVVGDSAVVDAANRFLSHLEARQQPPAIAVATSWELVPRPLGTGHLDRIGATPT